jgi:hypothetical protein
VALCNAVECSQHSIAAGLNHVEKAMPAMPAPLNSGPSFTTLAFERSCHSGRLHTMIRSHHRGAGKRTFGPAMIPEKPSPCASELPSLPKEALQQRVPLRSAARYALASSSEPLPRTAAMSAPTWRFAERN